MNIMRLVARPLLASPFIIDGVDALRSPHKHVVRAQALTESCEPVINRLGIEITDEQMILLSRVMGATSVIAGLSLATGKAPRSAAGILAVLSIPVAAVNASHSIHNGEAGDFARRLAMIGALAIASADRVGAPSAHWRFNSWRDERRERLQAQAQALRPQIAQANA